MRAITDHHINLLNRNIEVKAGPAGPGGMPVDYELTVLTGPNENGARLEAPLDLRFQRGSPDERINGISNEALLVVLIDRLRGAQGALPLTDEQKAAKSRHEASTGEKLNLAPFACRENAVALTHLEESLMWLQKRSRERASRGVEGQQVP